jgi:hypothetical protein
VVEEGKEGLSPKEIEKLRNFGVAESIINDYINDPEAGRHLIEVWDRDLANAPRPEGLEIPTFSKREGGDLSEIVPPASSIWQKLAKPFRRKKAKTETTNGKEPDRPEQEVEVPSAPSAEDGALTKKEVQELGNYNIKDDQYTSPDEARRLLAEKRDQYAQNVPEDDITIPTFMKRGGDELAEDAKPNPTRLQRITGLFKRKKKGAAASKEYSGTAAWEALTPEEKQDRLDKRKELREGLVELKKARERYVAIQHELDNRRAAGEPESELEDLRRDSIAASDEYKALSDIYSDSENNDKRLQKESRRFFSEVDRLRSEPDGEKKNWDDMTPLEKRSELREKVLEMKKARTNLVVLESELNKRKALFGLGRVRRLFSKDSMKDLEEKYEMARKNHEEKRAEYVGEKTLRLIKEKQKMAEAAASKNEEGVGEKFKKGWRWLGDQNLEKWTGWKPQNKVARILSRTLSARTAASLVLLGGGLALGAGSAVGITAIGMRRVLAGTGTGMGIYDLLRMSDEKKAIRSVGEIDQEELKRIDKAIADTKARASGDKKIWKNSAEYKKLVIERDAVMNKRKVDKLSIQEIEQAMAEMEARSRFSGRRVVREGLYQDLRREYVKRINDQSDKEEAIKNALLSTDAQRLVKGKSASRREIRMKAEGLAAGVIVGGGYLADLIKNGIFPPGTTEEEVREVIAKGGVVAADTVDAQIADEPALPAVDLDAADSVRVATSPAPGTSAPTVPSAPPPSTANPAPIAPPVPSPTPIIPADPTATVSETMKVDILGEVGEIEVPTEHIGTVKAGGSVWQAAQEMVRSGAISKEDFARAWSSPASTVELPSGQTIHISEFGLVHAGNQILYVPESGDVPAHFEVADYTNKSLRVGSNEDLAQAFDAAGRARPAWLVRALEEQEVEPADAVDPNPAPRAPQVPGPEIVQGAGSGSENLFTEGVLQTEGLDPFTTGATESTLTTPAEVTPTAPTSPEAAPEGEMSEDEIIEGAAENEFEQRPVMKFPWGTLDLVYNSEGNSAGFVPNIDTSLSPRVRLRAVQRAVSFALTPDYTEALEESIRKEALESVGGGEALAATVEEALPDTNAKVQEFAFRMHTLRQAFDHVEPRSREWYQLRTALRGMVRTYPSMPGKFMIGGRIVPTSIINNNIIP